MSDDLFRDSFATRPAPARSRWMIALSVAAHVAAIGALVIVPVLSAFDTFVLHANDMLVVSIPAATVPPAPRPPKIQTAIDPKINPEAAPMSPSQKPVTDEVPRLDFNPGVGVPGAPAGGGDKVVIDNVPPRPPAVTKPAPDKPVEPFRPGGAIQPPARITYVEPVYPATARNARIEGTVILEATIDASGAVQDVRVLRSIPLLDRAAMEAVARWRYTPTRLNGVAVPILLTVTVTFTLR